jgi:hypothetical protein
MNLKTDSHPLDPNPSAQKSPTAELLNLSCSDFFIATVVVIPNLINSDINRTRGFILINP